MASSGANGARGDPLPKNADFILCQAGPRFGRRHPLVFTCGHSCQEIAGFWSLQQDRWSAVTALVDQTGRVQAKPTFPLTRAVAGVALLCQQRLYVSLVFDIFGRQIAGQKCRPHEACQQTKRVRDTSHDRFLCCFVRAPTACRRGESGRRRPV